MDLVIFIPSYHSGDDEKSRRKKIEEGSDEEKNRKTMIFVEHHSRDNEINNPGNGDEYRSERSPPEMLLDKVTSGEVRVGADVDGVQNAGDEERSVEECISATRRDETQRDAT